MTETIDRNATRLQHAFGVLWSMATMAFWMWLFGYSLLAVTQNYASSEWPVFLQASTITATTGLILLAVRLNSNSIRLESVVAVGIFNILAQSIIVFGNYGLNRVPMVLILSVFAFPLVGLFSDQVVKRVIKGQTRLVSELIWIVLAFTVRSQFTRHAFATSHHGPIDDREYILSWTVISIAAISAGIIHFVRRNKVPPLCLPETTPLVRLAKIIIYGGLKVRIYIYIVLFAFAVASLVYVYVFNNGWSFI